MIEKIVTRGRNVVDLSAYRQRAHSVTAQPMIARSRLCSHCGAVLLDGESEDECSTLDAASSFRATMV